jgi:hypothetical protein
MASDSVDLEEGPVPAAASDEATAPPIEEEPAEQEPSAEPEHEPEPAPVEDPAGVEPPGERSIESILNPVTLPCSFIVGESRTDWLLDVHHDDWRAQFANMLRSIANSLDPLPQVPLTWPPLDISELDILRLMATADQNGGVAPVST